MTKAEIQTLLTDSGCIESCLSSKTLLSVIVQLLFASGGIPTPTTDNYRVTDDGSIRVTDDGSVRVVDV